MVEAPIIYGMVLNVFKIEGTQWWITFSIMVMAFKDCLILMSTYATGDYNARNKNNRKVKRIG